jgi:hypothetical protein
MDFTSKILKYIFEATSNEPIDTGTSLRKETKMSSATDKRSRDAARKRAERASKPKKSQLSSAELIAQVIAVRTGEGATELIYKDSYNPNYHELINPEKDLSIEDAKAYTKDETFVQTQASQQLFGDLKKKAEAQERKRASDEVKAAEGEEGGEPGPEVEEPKFVKPKKMSVQDLLASMSEMEAGQLGSIPFELRQEYFLQNRDPMDAEDFDNLTFETVANKFGITKVDLPFNEQVKNALIMMSRIKAGASDQELSFVTNLKNGMFTQFGREAFEQAKKILSQVGDECLQLMVSASEAGLAGVSAEGKTDFKCGGIKFAVNAQGEISLSSGDPTQQGKEVKKNIQRSLVQTMQDPSLAERDPIYREAISTVNDMMAMAPTGLISDSSFEQLSKDPNVFAFMQNEPVISATGQNLGPMLMPSGELNPAISYKKFESDMERVVDRFIAQEKSKKAPFMRSFVKAAVSNQIRGDGSADPESTPSHLVTSDGIFPMSDEYFSSVSSNSDINISKANGKDKGKKHDINKFKVMIEQAQVVPMDPNQQIRDLIASVLTPVGASPIEVLANTLTKNYNFDMNVSLLPGVKPKDIHGVEYNYVNVQGKKFKIPVIRDQELVAAKIEESYLAANDILLESMENNDVLRAMYFTKIINFDQAESIVASRKMSLHEATSILGQLVNVVAEAIASRPSSLSECIEYIEESKKRKRNYKREYKLFHGKPSQIKKRAKRVQARRDMEDEGKVHKGDGKDVDHKKPLRNGGTSARKNLRVRDRGENRSDNGKYKGQPADKPRTDE